MRHRRSGFENNQPGKRFQGRTSRKEEGEEQGRQDKKDQDDQETTHAFQVSHPLRLPRVQSTVPSPSIRAIQTDPEHKLGLTHQRAPPHSTTSPIPRIKSAMFPIAVQDATPAKHESYPKLLTKVGERGIWGVDGGRGGGPYPTDTADDAPDGVLAVFQPFVPELSQIGLRWSRNDTSAQVENGLGGSITSVGRFGIDQGIGVYWLRFSRSDDLYHGVWADSNLVHHGRRY